MGRLREAQPLVVSTGNPRFIICGSGRSGTSAVAQLLHRAGISVGHDLIEPDEHNAEGYFEERQVIKINQAIINATGIGPPFSTATREQVISAAEEYKSYMVEQAAIATPAWKDPRFCWTLEAWLPVLDTRPKVIVCLRSPGEVAASTMRYFGQVGEDAAQAVYHVWRVQYERLLEVLSAYGLEALPVEYAELHSDPPRAVERVSDFVGVPIAASTLRSDLRHHEVRVPDELRALYDRVRAL
jgi:hypothetical protein